MKVWLVKDGEHLPIQEDARPMRMWLLAKALRDRGHDVTWWASTFSHQRKSFVAHGDQTVWADGIKLRLLDSGRYSRNVSYARIRHHRLLARRFALEALREPSPAVIVSAFPIVELAESAVRTAQLLNVPSIVDIRDLWPDVFVDKAPPVLKPVVQFAVAPVRRTVQRTMANVTGIVGVSPSYLQWGLDFANRAASRRDSVFYLGCGDQGAPDWEARAAGPMVCAFVGSFGLSYDLDVVCDAAQLVMREAGAEIQFVLAGDGQQFPRIEARARELPNVSVTGWVGRSAVHSILQSASVGLSPVNSIPHPSTLSNKIFEYMAAGLPVISSVQGETTRLLVESGVGFAFSRGDAKSLAEAILTMWRDPVLRKRQGETARQMFEERFSADVIYPSYAEFVEYVVSNG